MASVREQVGSGVDIDRGRDALAAWSARPRSSFRCGHSLAMARTHPIVSSRRARLHRPSPPGSGCALSASSSSRWGPAPASSPASRLRGRGHYADQDDRYGPEPADGHHPHRPLSPPCDAATLQLAACIPNMIIHDNAHDAEPHRSQPFHKPLTMRNHRALAEFLPGRTPIIALLRDGGSVAGHRSVQAVEG